MNKKYTSDEVIALYWQYNKYVQEHMKTWHSSNSYQTRLTFDMWLKQKEESDIDSIIDTAIEMKKDLQYAQNIWVSNDKENWFRDMFIGYDIDYIYTKNSSEVHQWKYFSLTDPNGIQ